MGTSTGMGMGMDMGTDMGTDMGMNTVAYQAIRSVLEIWFWDIGPDIHEPHVHYRGRPQALQALQALQNLWLLSDISVRDGNGSALAVHLGDQQLALTRNAAEVAELHLKKIVVGCNGR